MAQDGEAAAVVTTIHAVARRAGVSAAGASRSAISAGFAAIQLDARITGGEPAGSAQVLPTQLVIRSSCGSPALSPSTDA